MTVLQEPGTNELFSAIVNSAPERLFLLFDTLISARESMEAPREIAGLTRISEEDFRKRGSYGGNFLFQWYEIFRDLYIIRQLEREIGRAPHQDGRFSPPSATASSNLRFSRNAGLPTMRCSFRDSAAMRPYC